MKTTASKVNVATKNYENLFFRILPTLKTQELKWTFLYQANKT